MIAVAWFQALLDGLGAVLAFLYDLIPNYGVAIILLTLGIRVLLLPLGIKQVRSMQAMQAIQPKVKEIQKKYKGNRQKVNEETMALYKQHGVNPLSGCLPLLAQFPVLIALFAVLRFPGGLTHIPDDSQLHRAIEVQDVSFLGSNLTCSATEAGRGEIQVADKDAPPGAPETKDCGKGIPVRIPYYVFAAAMVATTFYQQRQMQKASPPGASSQQQALTKIMPIMFGVWGFIFPAGLVVYWTTTNAVQIGQQFFLLSQDRGNREGASAPGGTDGARKTAPGKTKELPGKGRSGPGSGQPRSGSRSQGRQAGRSSGGSSTRKRSARGGSSGATGSGKRAEGGPGGDRKKRRKR